MSDPAPPAETPAAAAVPASGPWQPPSAEELQKLLPQYEITALLGRGGMGAVYKGTQIALDRPVAIKILSNTLEEADASFAERFKNEARALGKLSHPGIVGVYDFGEAANGLLYIVMEFIDGTDVARMLAKQGRLHTEHAMAITAHVCDALAYAHAHERGIIHRDIKPANVMVGYDGVVKVADFGLAKMTQSQNSGLTQSGMAMGTLHYMAPEALMLGSAVDQRADIYAVGVMLYQMLTGKLPQGLFEMPSLQVPGLDPRYDGIISKALREDREVRYPSILDLRRDLDAILTQPVVKVDVAAAKVSAALNTQARPQRNAGQPYRPPQTQPQVLVRPEKKSSLLLWLVAVVMVGFVLWFYVNRSQTDSKTVSLAESSIPILSVNGGNAPPVMSLAADSDAKLLLNESSSVSATRASATEVSLSGAWLDTLALVDTAKHGNKGSVWRRTANGIDRVSSDLPPVYASTIQIPVSLPPSYAVEVEFTCVSSVDAVGVLIPVGDGRVPTCWIGGNKSIAGIAHIDAKDPWDLVGIGAASPLQLMEGRHYLILAEVRRGAEGVDIRFFLDGKLQGGYRGPTARLKRSTKWVNDEDNTHVRLGASQATVFNSARMKRLDGMVASNPQAVLEAASVKLVPQPHQVPLPTGLTTWTDTKGRSITATFKALASGNVLLDIAGNVTPVPLNTLSAESQKLARALAAAQAPPTQGIVGKAFDAITLADIVKAQDLMKIDQINASDGRVLTVGTVLIYRTCEGRFGRARVEAPAPFKSDVTLFLSWNTFESDGSTRSSGRSFELRRLYAIDLDDGRLANLNDGADLHWGLQSADSPYLAPVRRNSAAIAIVPSASFVPVGTTATTAKANTPPSSPVVSVSPPASKAQPLESAQAGERKVFMLQSGVEMAFRWIPPGTFLMGSPEAEAFRPNTGENQFEVTLTDGYWMAEAECTQAQWEAVIGSGNASYFKGASLPVTNLNWEQAADFCKQLGEALKLPKPWHGRLPTEAQWEYACRAGTTSSLNDGKSLSGATLCPNLDKLGWYNANSIGTTHEVARKRPNAWGLHDMHGNVREWCSSWFAPYPTRPQRNPRDERSGTARVIRGASFKFGAGGCRAASRDKSAPSEASEGVGFRPILAPK
jgi:serine/threonine protein kinase/formylglycine-generating enzyme required for sulfatase activity